MGWAKNIKLLDPNLLACKEHEELLQQLINSGAYVDFTQGIDARLVNDRNVELLRKIKVKMIHFAWDNPADDMVDTFKYIKSKLGIDSRRMRVYVLTNYWSTHEQDLYRVYKLRELGYEPYVMIYEKDTAPKNTRDLQRWVNNKFIFRSCERFEDYKSGGIEMKKGITAYSDYDVNGRWCLIIEKNKGKLTLDEIKEAAREHEWDFYLLVLDCYHDEDIQFLEAPAGDKVTLYRTDALNEGL